MITINHQPSTINHQPSTINHQPSTKYTLTFILLIIISFSVQSANFSFTPPNIDFLGAADSVKDYTIIASSPTQTSNQNFCTYPGNTRLYVRSVYAASGYTVVVEGATYPIFKSTVPGIGFIVKARSGAPPNFTEFTPVREGETLIRKVSSGEIGMNYVFSWVKYPGEYVTGDYVVNLGQIMQVICKNSSNAVVNNNNYLTANPINASFNISSCSLDSPGIEQISMGSMDWRSLSSLSEGATSADLPSASASINLQCEKGITLYATITDVNERSSTSNILSLDQSQSIVAKGVGYSIFVNGSSTAQSFGPESASPGTTNQFILNNKLTVDTPITVDLDIKAVRNGDAEISGGIANASAIITFSYQ